MMEKFMRSEKGRRSFRLAWCALMSLMMVAVLTGCSGGGSGNHDGLSSGVGGTFIDSPVQGLNYMTASGSGITDENGRFYCPQGEMIRFMIGDVMLGEVPAKDVVTPMDFIDPSELSMGFNHPVLVNMGRFLQSLDADGNPENGITITQEVRDQVSGRMIDFHQSMYDFENDPDVMAMFATMNGLNIPHNGMMWELVDDEGAKQHMMNHMGKYMTGGMTNVTNPPAGTGAQPGGDVNNLPMNDGNMMGGPGEINPDTPMDGTMNNNMGGNGMGGTGGMSSGVGGTFIDSPVQGLNYTTASGSGVTDANGRFYCPQGEMVRFMIGDVVLGETWMKDVITPMDFIDPAEWIMGFNHPMLVNMGRFLQSLDADGNPENGITITEETRNEISGRMIDFHQSIRDFENDPDVLAVFAAMNGLNMPHNGMMWELVDDEGAKQHMIDHMTEYMPEDMKDMMDEHMGQGIPGTVDMPMDPMGGQNPMSGPMNYQMGQGMSGAGTDMPMGPAGGWMNR